MSIKHRVDKAEENMPEIEKKECWIFFIHNEGGLEQISGEPWCAQNLPAKRNDLSIEKCSNCTEVEECQKLLVAAYKEFIPAKSKNRPYCQIHAPFDKDWVRFDHTVSHSDRQRIWEWPECPRHSILSDDLHECKECTDLDRYRRFILFPNNSIAHFLMTDQVPKKYQLRCLAKSQEEWQTLQVTD